MGIFKNIYIEIVLIAGILVYVLQTIGGFSVNKFVEDNASLFKKLQEKDYEFYLKAKYGDAVDIDQAFNSRVKNGLFYGFIIMLFLLNSFNYVALLIVILGFFLGFKSSYWSCKNYYKKHLHLIDQQLPYYLKNLEILIQHYTVPVALGKSLGDAPEIFQDGLHDLVEKINAGDSSIQPYMDFAKEYPVRDSMRMMRLLYRLGLGKQERKQEQLLTFSRDVSLLQQKAREARYKDRLDHMESQTMKMLVCTGGGVMIILVLAILQTFQGF